MNVQAFGRWIVNTIHVLIAIVFFLIPFFWLKPGEVDLGGDSGRLYFYDPVSFIRNVSLYTQVPEGLGPAEPNTYYLPYVALIAALSFFFHTPTTVISIITGLKLGIGFLAMYGIVKEVIGATSSAEVRVAKLAGIMSGIFYVLAPSMIGNYDKALTSHNQVFLNPLMFYLLLKFLSDSSVRYLSAALFTSFVFAPNFALTSAPPFFAFYPFAVVYVLLFMRLVLRKPIPWKLFFRGGGLFLGIQAFHLLPQIINLFEPGSFTNTRVFDRTSIMQEGVRYFTGILPLASISNHIFMVPMISWLTWVSIIAPCVIIIGFLSNNRSRALILTAGFYLVFLYLYSAKITGVGVEFYKNLFYLPGFSMFRNFIGQWTFVYTFFYALLFGIAAHAVLRKISSRRWKVYVVIVITLAWVGSSWPFLKGETVNKIHTQTDNMRMTFTMDPRYEEVLAFIRTLADDGKILTLPLTDAYYQVLAGSKGGAYVGTSTISQLTGKKDFNGYQIFGPFAEAVMKSAREKNYQAFTSMLSQFSIRYIFHNSDPAIYEAGFPQTPYTYMKTSFPQTQKGYEEFIAHLPAKRIYTNGSYNIYELDASVRRAELYVGDSTGEPVNDGAAVRITKSDPVTYQISYGTQRADPGALVLNNTFNHNWKLIINGTPTHEDRHFTLHGYANAWRLSPDDLGGKNEYTMTLTLISQRYAVWGWSITIVTLAFVGGWCIQHIRHETV